jgi:hypothetical protein
MVSQPTAPDPASAPAPARVALRVTGPEAGAFPEALPALWRAVSGGGRTRARIELSVVETCGRCGDDRQRDALRLLRAEANAVAGSVRGAALRATVVRIDAREQWVMLAAQPDRATREAVDRLVAELATRFRGVPLPQG